TKVLSSNITTNSVSYSTQATSAISGASLTAWVPSTGATDISTFKNLLVTGTNVIAVELHQRPNGGPFGGGETDVLFNLELIATVLSAIPDTTPPEQPEAPIMTEGS